MLVLLVLGSTYLLFTSITGFKFSFLSAYPRTGGMVLFDLAPLTAAGDTNISLMLTLDSSVID